MATAHELFRSARDSLLAARTDYDRAVTAFQPPRPAAFNWALDWFDAIAARERPDRRAADRRGGRLRARRSTFGELSARSDQVATWLRATGVDARRPGAAHARQPGRAVGDDARRHEARRGHHPGHDRCSARPTCATGSSAGTCRHVIARAEDAAKFDDVPGDYTRDRGRRATVDRAGCDYADAPRRASTSFTPGRRHPRRRPAAALLHLRHDGAAQARRAHPRVLPGRAPVDDVLDRAAARATCTSTSPRRAGPSTRGPTSSRRGSPRRRSLVYNYSAVRRRRRCSRRCATARVTTFCAPPTVWRMLDPGRPRGVGGPAPLREVVGAGEPLNPEVIEQVERAWGLTDPRRLRPDRDHAAGRQLARPARSSPARWAGRCRATTSSLLDPVDRASATATRGRDLPRPRAAAPGRADDRLPRRRRAQRRGDARRLLPHRRRRLAATTTATSPTSGAPTTSSRPATTGSARSSWRAC